MKRKMLVATLTLTATLGVASSAQAKWYMNHTYAEQRAKTVVVDLYGDDYGIYNPAISCRPQDNRNQGRVRSMHHRWVCGWAKEVDGDMASGAVLIAGTDGSYAFRYSVWRGIRWA